MNLSALNQEYADQDPQAIIAHALSLPGKAVVTTHFGPLEAVILQMASKVKPDIQVLWVDHGYNTKATYRAAEKIIEMLKLNVGRVYAEGIGGTPGSRARRHSELHRRRAQGVHRELQTGTFPPRDGAAQARDLADRAAPRAN